MKDKKRPSVDAVDSKTAADANTPAGPVFHIMAQSLAASRQYKSGHTNPQGDSGVDLRFPKTIVLAPGEVKEVGLGVRAWCEIADEKTMGDGSVMWRTVSLPFHLWPRSSIGKTPLLATERASPMFGGEDTSRIGPGPRMRSTAARERAPVPYPLTGDEGIIPGSCPDQLSVELTNTSSEPYTIAAGTALFQLCESRLRPPTYVVAAEWRPPRIEHMPETDDAVDCYLKSMSAKLPESDKVTILPLPADTVFPAGAVTTVELGYKAAIVNRRTGDAEAFYLMSHWDGAELIMKNWIGIIDRGYRGQLMAKVYNASDADITLAAGVPAFMVLAPFVSYGELTILGPDDPNPLFAEGATLRGAGGFGSTNTPAATPSTNTQQRSLTSWIANDNPIDRMLTGASSARVTATKK